MYPKIAYRFSILVLACIFIVSLNGREASASFSDIPKDYSTEIGFLITQGIINGYPDQTFKPQNQVTREEAVTMVGRALGYNGTQRATSFQDMKLADYSSGYIQSALEQQLLSMPADKKFRPKDKMTRGEMAYLLQRAFDLKEKSLLVTISDVSGNGPLSDAINSLMTAGLSNGYPDGSFKPNNKMTRTEFSLFIARGLNEDYRVDNGLDPIDELKPIAEAVVNATSLNVRSTPSTKGNVIGGLPDKAKVTIYQYEGKWALISSGNTYGYVHTDYLMAPPPPVKEEVKPTPPPPPKEPEPTPPPKEEEEDATPNEEDKNDSSPIEEDNNDSSPNEQDNESEPAPEEDESTVPPEQRIIAIDAGHGDQDPGAIANGLQEKEINLAVSLKVEKILKDKGYQVVMTRRDDTFLELKERVNVAVAKKADTFVSIHSNKFDKESANGTETYFSTAALNPRAEKSKQLATFIQERLHKALGTTDRGVKEQNFLVIKSNPLPSVLVELGFISNKADAEKLASDKYRDLAAEAIALGIEDYYNWRD